MNDINTIVFDLGGVLIDWNPDYVYRDIIPDEKKENGSMKIFVHLTGMKNKMPAGPCRKALSYW
jgi:hypothetical protein